MSSRGRRPYRALPEARAIAVQRGCVQMAEHGPECRYDFTITNTLPVAFIIVRFAPRVLAAQREIEAEFHTAILPLRSIASDGSVSRELWLRSKHGTWRFFRVTADGIVEIDRHGQVLADKEGSVSGPVTV